MGVLQQSFDDNVEKQAKPEQIIFAIMLRKLKKATVHLPKSLRSALEIEVKRALEDPTYSINFDERKIRRYNPHLSEDCKIDLTVTNRDIEAHSKRLSREMSKVIPEIVKKSAADFYKALRSDRHITLALVEYQRSEFETRLQKFWRIPIETLDLLIACARQAAVEFLDEHHEEFEHENNLIYESIVRIHARACKISQEVLALIKSGFADGANARWRTMHELMVVATFIVEHAGDVAKRYLLHQHVDNYKAALQMNDHYRKLGYKKIPAKEIRRMKTIVDKLVAEFGEEFRGDYGWAAKAIGKRNPRFAEIESAIHMTHLRPYYKMASQSVHAGPRAAFFSLGLIDNDKRLLAGASNSGFTDPAQNTALTLLNITVLLLNLKPTIDSLVWAYALTMMAPDVGEAFFKKQQRLDQMERRKKMGH